MKGITNEDPPLATGSAKMDDGDDAAHRRVVCRCGVVECQADRDSQSDCERMGPTHLLSRRVRLSMDVGIGETPDVTQFASWDSMRCGPWQLVGNIYFGLVAVAFLTLASKHLLRAIVVGLGAILSKPPPPNEKGD